MVRAEVPMQPNRRVLSDTVRRARKMHICDGCEEKIFPGDLYENRVEVRKYGRRKQFVERKEHVHPGCHYPEDDRERTEITDIVVPFLLAA